MLKVLDYDPNDFELDVEGIAWTSSDGQVAITDPFLAVLISSKKPGFAQHFVGWYETSEIDALESHCGELIHMEVFKDFQEYPAGSIIRVQLDEPLGCGFNGFILPNGYTVEIVKEAIEHFRLH